MDSRRSSFVDEDAKIRLKHEELLQDYLILQKECVSKKRKLKEAKEKKEFLMDEIRFLKQRRNFLLRMQSQKSEQFQVAQSLKQDAKYDGETSGRHLNVGESSFKNSQPPLGSTWNMGSVGKEEVGFPPLRIGKKPKDLYTSSKRAGKRKMSWQDQVALKV